MYVYNYYYHATILDLQFVPEEGITVYANMLHTHTVGEYIHIISLSCIFHTNW